VQVQLGEGTAMTRVENFDVLIVSDEQQHRSNWIQAF